MSEPVTVITVSVVWFAVAMCVPAIRAGLLNYFAALRRTFLELRELVWITPLRAITGRRRPDYLRIRELERRHAAKSSDSRAELGE